MCSRKVVCYDDSVFYVCFLSFKRGRWGKTLGQTIFHANRCFQQICSDWVLHRLFKRPARGQGGASKSLHVNCITLLKMSFSRVGWSLTYKHHAEAVRAKLSVRNNLLWCFADCHGIPAPKHSTQANLRCWICSICLLPQDHTTKIDVALNDTMTILTCWLPHTHGYTSGIIGYFPGLTVQE